MRPDRWVTGWAVLRCTGPDPAALLTRLGARGIPFWDAQPPENFVLTLCVPLSRLGPAERTAAAAGFETAVLARHGLPALLPRLRRRWLPALLLAALAFLLVWSEARIWAIDITGNESIPDGRIRQALAECGVDIGARWVGMSQDAVRNGVILRLPGIRWMTVTMQGSRARVIVREKRAAIEPVPEAEFANVLADRAGLVTAVYALRGTAQTEPGRALLPGDTILGGFATGRFGVQGPVRAIGYAEARTWYELTAAAPAHAAEKRLSGSSTAAISLIFGRTRINFYKGSSICPPGCDKIIKNVPLEIPGVFTLPIALERVEFRPYETEPVRAEERGEELCAALAEELGARLGAEGEVVTAEYSVWEDGGMLYATLAAECRERIGVTAPMTEAEIAAVLAKIPKTEE